ncbi:MAG: VCBS repeat-containing protein, partial [Myxococcales bacterium]|nr:VCBS repeat-containing protein [Myxococcales bacterium]
ALADAAGCVRCTGTLNDASGLRQVVDLDGDGMADYVNRAGLYVTQPGSPPTLVRVLQPGRPWNFMDVADLNHDGLVDVVATRPGVVDVVLAAGAGRYNVLSAPTEGSPSQVAVGDFDGDLIEDIAIVEGQDTVSVLFSGRQGVATERVVMAELPAVARLSVTQNDEDAINDLVVTVPTPGGEDLLVQLRGDSSRRMASTIPRRAPVTVSVAAGRFTGQEQLDVMIAEPRMRAMGAGGGGGGMGPPKQFRLASMEGPFGASRLLEQTLPMAEGCTYPAGGFMVSTAADLDGDGVDSFVAVQTWGPDFPTLATRPYGVRALSVVEGELRCAGLAPIETSAAPLGVDVADLDGDGALDVVIGLGLPRYPGAPVGLPEDATPGVAVYWGDAAAPGRLATAPTVYPIDPTGPGRLVLAVFEANGRAGADVAFVDDTRLGLATFDAARQITVTRVGNAASGARALRALDADGDGLDDLVVATGNELLVYHQRPCDARRAELGGCTRPAP